MQLFGKKIILYWFKKKTIKKLDLKKNRLLL